jgi:hypothetical protein
MQRPSAAFLIELVLMSEELFTRFVVCSEWQGMQHTPTREGWENGPNVKEVWQQGALGNIYISLPSTSTLYFYTVREYRADGNNVIQFSGNRLARSNYCCHPLLYSKESAYPNFQSCRCFYDRSFTYLKCRVSPLLLSLKSLKYSSGNQNFNKSSAGQPYGAAKRKT